MASIQKKGDGWYCQFCYRGQRPTFALGKVSEDEARAKSSQVDYMLMRLKQRLIDLPPGVEIVDFVRYDGKPPASLVNSGSAALPTKTGTLAVLRDRFLTTHAGAHEAGTLGTARTHFKHIAATLGDHFPLAELTLPDLQRHVDRRAAKGIAPVTIRKEIDGLRAAWNWGKRTGLVALEWPGRGLVYRKTKEKPPFQTRAEITRQIARGGLTDDQKKELWESLYLAAAELSIFLEHVSLAARHAFIYPMICTAAHTGARRSELLRRPGLGCGLRGRCNHVAGEKEGGAAARPHAGSRSRLSWPVCSGNGSPTTPGAITCSASPARSRGAGSSAAPPATATARTGPRR